MCREKANFGPLCRTRAELGPAQNGIRAVRGKHYLFYLIFYKSK